MTYPAVVQQFLSIAAASTFCMLLTLPSQACQQIGYHCACCSASGMAKSKAETTRVSCFAAATPVKGVHCNGISLCTNQQYFGDAPAGPPVPVKSTASSITSLTKTPWQLKWQLACSWSMQWCTATCELLESMLC